jgi:hypothetical protein
MPFIRVKSAGGPDHEYDTPLDQYEANPGDYVVVDSEPVEFSREPLYVLPAAAKAVKPAPEPSVGNTNKENN